MSYEFKRFRFTHLHREALKFPEDRFFFIGTQGLYSKAAADVSLQSSRRTCPCLCAPSEHHALIAAWIILGLTISLLPL